MKIFTTKLGGSAYMSIIVLAAMAIFFVSMGLVPYFKQANHISYYDFIRLQKNNIAIPYVILTPLFIAVCLAYSYWNRVRLLTIAEGKLIIERKRKTVSIALGEVDNILLVPTKDIMFSTYQDSTWRRSLVGFTGKYYNKNYGEMQWYCTKSKNYVLLTLKDKRKIAFTPDEPERFVNEVKRWLND